MVARRSGRRASEPGRGVPGPAPALSTRGGGPRRTKPLTRWCSRATTRAWSCGPLAVVDAAVVGAVTVDDIQRSTTSSAGSAAAPAVRHLIDRAEDSPGRDQGPFLRPALWLRIAGKPFRRCRCTESGEGPIPMMNSCSGPSAPLVPPAGAVPVRARRLIAAAVVIRQRVTGRAAR